MFRTRGFKFPFTGFPVIVATRTTWRKVMKVLVFVGCTCGFLYQTSEFLEMYWGYPTMVDIQVENPDSVELPAISFCNANRLYFLFSYSGPFSSRFSFIVLLSP
ncbi:hypothetical protein AVEN_91686-1 [Araneus ventricosus]|uniref:Uncharacterized protein n=1 Tax=Araneus ventricosus TaxID=182803 RepID=A0A4Y2R0C5_ARAVE|nr:hypothetical protein AVEN_228814-1 [Araneus ventricosus]GBN69127.1 hypothetical protein AVEN_91686-1 [Araneus ventricosus]